MADASRNIVLALLVVGVALAVFYMMDPTFGGLLRKREGFQSGAPGPAGPAAPEGVLPQGPASVSGMDVTKYASGPDQEDEIQKLIQASKDLGDVLAKNAKKETFQGANGEKKMMEGFENPASTPFPEAAQPANCYPKNQLAPEELLPADPTSKWAQANPTGAGDISGKNFLSAGALIGVNTVGQSLRNANQQLRSEPPCPQAQVSIWNQSTIEPDLQRRPLEGF